VFPVRKILRCYELVHCDADHRRQFDLIWKWAFAFDGGNCADAVDIGLEIPRLTIRFGRGSSGWSVI